ncbi:MAG TPA: asparagine synthetase B, partial [Ruminococcaceae bacterium]|nr:asparagine synthetase B [Oscillospiraceae bacterium]
MCGIVGFIGSRANQKIVLQKMMDAIAHRGPDGQGAYFDDQAALGHLRLSIIDIKGGSQPMMNEDGNYIIVFNGEIYNFQELREELLRDGHIFRSHCDTEVLLHGYEQWGKDMLARLRGMFAFAIWNKREKTLFCARDHFGIKPLYYYQNSETGTLMFSSEIKSFLEHPEFVKELNPEQLQLYLSYQYSPGENT